MQFIRSFVLKPFTVAFLAVFCLTAPAFGLTKLDEDLIYHANFGEAEKIKSLLEAGANPDAIGEDGWPAISLATMRSDKEGEKIVHLLVEAGANLNVRDANGETPLMNAISINSPALVKYMIERGADFHAISTSGRNVQAFSQHYANEDVSALIEEAIRLENQRIAEGRAPKRMYRIMDDFIYYNCAAQYIAYNKAQKMYPETDMERINQLFSQVMSKVGNAEVELEYNFFVKKIRLKRIQEQTQQSIYDELEALISKRNRIKHGVGTDTDLDKRCKKILVQWRDAYPEYENQGAMKDSGY